MKQQLIRFLFILLSMGWLSSTFADQVTVPMAMTTKDGTAQQIGSVVATDTPHGLLLTPNLNSLMPGLHGFHVHVNPSCADNGMAAGGHLDPAKTDKHLGPYSDQGHLGDLPALYVSNDGTATTPELAPRLKVSDLKGHSLMIHAGGDNYSDNPKLGGGGARIACGVIQ